MPGILTLLSDLRPLNAKARGLYERVTAEGYAEDEGDVVAVSVLAEDLQDALLVYWVSAKYADTAVVSLKLVL